MSEHSPIPPDPIPWGRALARAFLPAFHTMHQEPERDLFRLGVAGFLAGNVLLVPGLLLGIVLVQKSGIATELFFVLAGWGALTFAAGVYRLGILAFPLLKETTAAARLLRIAYLLICGILITAPILYLIVHLGLLP